MKRFLWLVASLGVTVAVGVGCSSDDRSRDLSLLGPGQKDAGGPLTSEEERLRKMQLVRVVNVYKDANGQEVRTTADVPADGLPLDKLPCICPTEGLIGGADLCFFDMCESLKRTCQAKALLSMALPQTGEIKIDNVMIPVVNPPPGDPFPFTLGSVIVAAQSTAANAALATNAMNAAQKAAYFVKAALDGMTGVPTDNPDIVACFTSPNYSDAFQFFGTISRYEAATAMFAELYHTETEAAEVAVKSILAVADAQLGSSTSLDESLSRMLSGSELSRAAAAHLLTGGESGFGGDTKKSFCRDHLSPDVKAAISVFRDAAISPAALADDSIPIHALLNGDSVTVPGGNVRERLGQFYGYTDLLSRRDVELHFGLGDASFARARTYLLDEISAFSRSTSATLPPRILPSGNAATFDRFAATATPPDYPPSTLYSAISRFSGNPNDVPHTWPNDYMSGPRDVPPRLYDLQFGMQPHAHFIDAALTKAAIWLGATGGFGPVGKAGNVTLAMLLAGNDRLGRLTIDSTGVGTLRVTAHGFRPADGLLLGIGDDALRCATTGSIEGAPCTIDSTHGGVPQMGEARNTVHMVSLSNILLAPLKLAAGFAQAAVGVFSAADLPIGNAYLLRPKAGLPIPFAPAILAPGKYEPILGFSKGEGGFSWIERAFPITPKIDQRADELLAPSKKWCAMPRTNCAGSFDDRMPLDDELANETPSVESSWKHYLALAQQAAQKADEIGTDYINSGLNKSQRTEELEIRKEQQIERADDEIGKLQAICGTSIDPRLLLDAITGGDPAGGFTPPCAATHSCGCGTNADCGTTGLTCSNSVCVCQNDGQCGTGLKCLDGKCICNEANSCGAGFQCVSGQCVVDYQKFAEKEQGDKVLGPAFQRIADCLKGAPADDFISLGTRSVCLWHAPNNPNAICEDENGVRVPAVSSCPKLNYDGLDCKKVLGIPLPPQTDPQNRVVKETQKLAFFDTSGDDPPDAKRCDSLAMIRNDSTRAAAHVNEVVGRPWIGRIREQAANIRFERQFDPAGQGTGIPNWGHMTVGEHNYQTGLTETGVGPTNRWPCAQRDPENCALCNLSGDDNDDTPKACSLFCRAFTCADPTSRESANKLMQRAVTAAQVIAFMGSGFKSEELATHGFPFTFMRHASVQFQNCPNGPPPSSCDPESTTCGDNNCTLSFDLSTQMRSPSGNVYMYSNKDGDWWTKELLGFMRPSTEGVEFRDSFLFIDTDTAHSTIFTPTAKNPVTGLSSLQWLQSALTGRDGHANIAFKGGGTFKLTGDDLLNGYEVLCDSLPGPGGITLSNPPTVSSVEDLGKVSEYIALLAKQIRDRTSLAVFANVPKSAQDNLKDQSAIGAYPKFGGDYGKALASLGNALLRIRENGPALANEITQFGNDVHQLRNTLQDHQLDKELSGLQFASTVSNQLASCASSIDVKNLFGLGMIASCANMIAQINFAAGIAEIQEKKADLASDSALGNFGASFSTRATSLQQLATRLAEASNDFNSALAEMENLRNAAKSSLARAIYLASFQAEHQAEVTNIVGNLFDGKQQRYRAALENAKKMAFLAKRAIEQRLGLHLAEMMEDLPLVDAPHNWENSVCTFSGLDFEALKSASPNAAQSFADGFIGDYVTKLSNVVESYRLQNSFHEGDDTAVISLRDDILNVRANCEVPTGNLLYRAAELDSTALPGWSRVGCPTEVISGFTVPKTGCYTIVREEGVAPPFADPNLVSGADVFDVKFGPVTNGDGSPADPALVQSLDVVAGRYRFSWYTQEIPTTTRSGGAAAEFIQSDLGIQFTNPQSVSGGSGWDREFREFVVPKPTRIKLGFHKAPGSSPTTTIAAPMLELLPGTKVAVDGGAPVAQEFAPLPFVNTTDKLTVTLPACEDTDGTVFRASQWTRRCLRLCPDGFSNDCSAERAQTHCFQETSFSIDQRGIQAGKIINFSGFARGNFNYRIENVGVNFVGTSTRNCDNAQLPSTCFGAGFIPYTIEHNGPFFIRNTFGDDVETLLFDGKIEHARGLASERYLTNPLSSADHGLIDQYVRNELIGRPLDGNFVLRVWEEPGVNFDAIADVQILLKYRYWTKFQ